MGGPQRAQGCVGMAGRGSRFLGSQLQALDWPPAALIYAWLHGPTCLRVWAEMLSFSFFASAEDLSIRLLGSPATMFEQAHPFLVGYLVTLS